MNNFNVIMMQPTINAKTSNRIAIIPQRVNAIGFLVSGITTLARRKLAIIFKVCLRVNKFVHHGWLRVNTTKSRKNATYRIANTPLKAMIIPTNVQVTRRDVFFRLSQLLDVKD